MKPLKATITEAVLRTVRTFPLLFPKWLRHQADAFYSLREREASKGQEKKNSIKTCGLLQGDFRWKAVSVILEITPDDLKQIHDWFKRHAPLGNYDAERDARNFDTQYVHQDSWRNLGWININKEASWRTLTSVEIAGSPCRSCYVTIQKLPNGFAYLSLYFFLDEKVAETITRMDVRHLEPYQQFSSLNFFSKNARMLEFVDQNHAVERTIKNNIASICEGVREASKTILSLWNIKKSDDELVLVADIYRDCNQPYFDDNVEKETDNFHYAVFERKHGFAARRYGDDIELIYMVDELKVDGVCIMSKKREELDTFRDYSERGFAIYDSHLFLSLLISTMRQFRKIASLSNEAVLNAKNDVRYYYQALFDADLALLRLHEQVAAISKSVKLVCLEPYQERANEACEYQLEQLKQFRQTISKRKNNSYDDVQFESLGFHRRYAIWIGFFVITQILLAAFSADWKKAQGNLSKLADYVLSLVPF